MKRIIITGILIALLIGAGVGGWKLYQYYSTHESTDDAYVEGDIVPVLPRVSGYISDVYIRENQKVEKGFIVARLDTADLYQKVKQAQAAYGSAEAQLTVAQANVENAQIGIEIAKTAIKNAKVRVWNTKNEYDRYQKLYDREAATIQKLEDEKAASESAQAELDMTLKRASNARAGYQTALKQLEVAKSAINQQQAAVDYAQLQLSYATIKAPVAGVVSKKEIEQGQLVQAGQPLMAIVQDEELWVVANFKETQLSDMETGQTVNIKVDAYPDHDFNGLVQSFAGATGAKFALLPPDNASGNYVKVVQRVPVKITIDTTSEGYKLLRPGLSVKVVVTTEKKRQNG